MGYAAIPLGTLMVRRKQWLESISVDSPYISSEKQAGMLGTRSGAPVAAAYAVAQYLGQDGYKKMVESCMDVTQYTENRITAAWAESCDETNDECDRCETEETWSCRKKAF